MHAESCKKLMDITRKSINQSSNSVREAGHLSQSADVGKTVSFEAYVLSQILPDSEASNLQDPQPENALDSRSGASSHSRTGSTQSGALPNFIYVPHRPVEDYPSEYESGHDNGGMSSFEFCKGDKRGRKVKIGSYLKPPSKWDDAEKWLVSVSQSVFNTKGKPKSELVQMTQGEMNSMKKVSLTKQATGTWQTSSHMLKSYHSTNCVGGMLSATEKLLSDDHGPGLYVMQQSFSGEFPGENMKRVDPKCLSDAGDVAPPHFGFRPVLAPPFKARVNASFDCYPIGDDMKEVSMTCEANGKETYLEPILRTEKPSSEYVISDKISSSALHEPPSSSHGTSSYNMPTPAVRSVSMRDMGTEMTPMASQEPSRTGTPIRATTPTMCSPVSSHPSTPRKVAPTPKLLQDFEAASSIEVNMIPSTKDIQTKTWQETMASGAHLGKSNITAWPSKEEEDEDNSKLLKKIDHEEVKKSVLETKATAWEVAEQAKYMARYKREEAKIQAWENHERAKTEDEMRRIEVKVERMRSHAHEKLLNKLAAAQRRAEERRAGAETKRLEQAAKTAQHADHIRRTGRLPSSFMCGLCH